MRKVALIGYSGHAFVVEEALNSCNIEVFGYFEKQAKKEFPLTYLGDENDKLAVSWIVDNDFVVALGDNKLRAKIYADLLPLVSYVPSSVIHAKASVSKKAQLGSYTQIFNAAIVQPYAFIGNGTLCNTGSIVEHECRIGEFCHISCGSVLCGGVTLGDFSFVGANAVVRQGINIGKNVIIGAGSVVVKDVPDNSIVMGNPSK